jgi:hypothetical protein
MANKVCTFGNKSEGFVREFAASKAVVLNAGSKQDADTKEIIGWCRLHLVDIKRKIAVNTTAFESALNCLTGVDGKKLSELKPGVQFLVREDVKLVMSDGVIAGATA